MTVKYEDEIYECLVDKQLTTQEIMFKSGRALFRCWVALTALERKNLVVQNNRRWRRVDEIIMCDGCGINPADLPAELCPGCHAYKNHTGAL